MRFLPCLCACLVPLAIARGQGTESFANPSVAPVTTIAAPSPPTLPSMVGIPSKFGVLIRRASREEVVRLLVQSGITPSEFASLVGPDAAPERAKIVSALATSQPLTLDQVEPNDVDVLIAVSKFASLDPRYRGIDDMSYFGVKLTRIKAKIAAEGMTPDNKVALLQIWNDATQALKDFQAVEKTP